MNKMFNKGYTSHIEYSDEDNCFIGHMDGMGDIVGFHADSVTDLRVAFEEAVDDYLETCEKLNRPPQKPYTGNLVLHIPPDIHSAIVQAAEGSGKSIHEWAAETFAEAVRH